MNQVSYREVNDGGSLGVVCVLGAVPVIAGAMFFMHGMGLQHTVIVPAAAVLGIPALMLPAIIGTRIRHRRSEAIAERLRPLGFSSCIAPQPEEKTAFYSTVSALEDWFGAAPGTGLPSFGVGVGAQAIQWFAREEGHSGALLFEYKFVLNPTAGSKVYRRTVLVCPVPQTKSGSGSGFTAFRVADFERPLQHKVAIQLPEFADLPRDWTFSGDSAAAVRFLTTPVRAELALGPPGESWLLQEGWVGCLFPGSLDADDLELFVRRARRVIG